MREIRDLRAEYFSNKALDAMDRLFNEGKLSDIGIESWHSEHLRTPYKYKQKPATLHHVNMMFTMRKVAGFYFVLTTLWW